MGHALGKRTRLHIYCLRLCLSSRVTPRMNTVPSWGAGQNQTHYSVRLGTGQEVCQKVDMCTRRLSGRWIDMPPVSRPEHMLVANEAKFLAPSALPPLKGSSPEGPRPHIIEKKRKEGKGRAIKKHLEVTA